MEDINRKMEELLNSQDALIWKMRMALEQSRLAIYEAEKLRLNNVK